jgi:hypothetical protein
MVLTTSQMPLAASYRCVRLSELNETVVRRHAGRPIEGIYTLQIPDAAA